MSYPYPFPGEPKTTVDVGGFQNLFLTEYRAHNTKLTIIAQLPRLKPGEYVKGDLIVSRRLAAQEMGFVLHGVCEETSAETGKTIQNYR